MGVMGLGVILNTTDAINIEGNLVFGMKTSLMKPVDFLNIQNLLFLMFNGITPRMLNQVQILPFLPL